MVVRILKLRAAPQPADVSDALAIAIAFANVDAQRARFAQAGVILPVRRTHATRLA
jgi:Holliday junction resolvasome RuvABC endonuclease subunit